MAVVCFEPALDDDERRASIYRGDLVVHAKRPASQALVDLAKSMLDEAFHPLDPVTAQHHMPVAEFAAVLARLKPQFIHHPRCKELIAQLLRELGCDPEQTYFDVPRLRSSTGNGYLTTGIAYAFHPHRDTWYSAPMCQINWWIPVQALTGENGVEFYPRYFSTAVRNSSNTYDYQEWNRSGRVLAASQVGRDERTQPKPLQALHDDPPIRPVPRPGDILIFSAAQLHASVPNTSSVTRYSIDFRTVHVGDAARLSGARNVDSQCTGSTMGDYLRCSDLGHLPEAVCRRYEAGPPQPAALNFADQG